MRQSYTCHKLFANWKTTTTRYCESIRSSKSCINKTISFFRWIGQNNMFINLLELSLPIKTLFNFEKKINCTNHKQTFRHYLPILSGWRFTIDKQLQEKLTKRIKHVTDECTSTECIQNILRTKDEENELCRGVLRRKDFQKLKLNIFLHNRYTSSYRVRLNACSRYWDRKYIYVHK